MCQFKKFIFFFFDPSVKTRTLIIHFNPKFVSVVSKIDLIQLLPMVYCHRDDNTQLMQQKLTA